VPGPPPSSLAELLDGLAAADDLDADRLVALLRDHPDLPTCDPTLAFAAARALHAHGGSDDVVAAAELAARAVQAGVGDAGPLFAACADRLAVWSGRRQPYGTLTGEVNGELELVPVDPRTTDEARAAAGVPALTDLRAGVERANRDRAVQRAGDAGLPRGARFCRIWRSPDAGELRRRWQGEGIPVWADGDELTIVHQDERAPIVGPVFGMVMWPVDDGGLFALTLRVERLPEAVFSYGFAPPGSAAAIAVRPAGRWRGPEAPAALPSRRDLAGTLLEHAVESETLGEPRRVSIYRPAGHTRQETLPVVYATDGAMFAPYARRLDAAIEADAVPRVVVVAAHGARPDQAVNRRAMEYLPGFDQASFERHHAFFCDELAAWAEAELGVSGDRERRAVFGCSDGGGHALAVGERRPDRFGHVIAYSSGMPPDPASRWDPAAAPLVHLCAGTLEGPFHQATEAWAAWLSAFGVAHHWVERVCGHDLIQWVEELPGALARAWGTPTQG
jgi:enterochelin esterase-like enzyme